MSIITVILFISTLVLAWYVCIDVFRYILQEHRKHEMEKRFWQIRRKRIREQTNIGGSGDADKGKR